MRASTPLFDALTMGLLNLCAAAALLALHTINAIYHWPNPFVTLAAPLGAAVFLILAAVWILEWTRRVRARRLAGAVPSSVAALPIRLSQPRPGLFHRRLHHTAPMRRLERLALWRHGAEDAESA